MIVRNERQALCVAVEMERRAIRVYERALMLTADEEVLRGVREILQDEQEHLRCFSSMKCCCQAEPEEERMLIQAMGAEVLFPGGVMELERARGLSTLKGLYEFAADSEFDAMQKYAEFAQRCEAKNVKEAFMSIAREEASHYAELRRRLAEID
ncbi:MAG: ferritin-like domain-containing protein [Clostridia bacterium]|nr:ferritin-like domain-containing protein [Clostridia bacterium]